MGFITPSELHADSTIGTIDFMDCELGDAKSLIRRKAECAEFEVPEDYENPSKKTIKLRVARIKANAKTAKADPVTLIAGGPGQGAVDAFNPSLGQLIKIRFERDIYLIDQRGTGKSNPLECPDIEVPDTLDEDVLMQYGKDCLSAIESDTRFYNTSNAVRDLDAVRAALGAEQWNLYGGSYGTRVALHYLRKYPEHARTVTIDGVAPPDWHLGETMSQDRQNALDLLFARCKNDKACNKSFPNFEEGVYQLIEELDEPRTIKLDNINNGQIEEFEFTKQHLTQLVGLQTYYPLLSSILPVVLHEAYANNNLAPIARQLKVLGANPMALNQGVFNSAACTEDVPFYQANPNETDSRFYGNDIISSLNKVCEFWPEGIRDTDFKDPVKSDKPILILSGSVDPVTPPKNGEQVAQHLSNSKHIVMDGQGHGLLTVGCMPKIVANFIDTASVNELDTECLEIQKPTPLFINFYGPEP